VFAVGVDGRKIDAGVREPRNQGLLEGAPSHAARTLERRNQAGFYFAHRDCCLCGLYWLFFLGHLLLVEDGFSRPGFVGRVALRKNS
jgi:hypothetical protein